MTDVRMLELELQSLSEELTAPARGECLSCYLERVLREFGCAGSHRFTRRWARSRRRGTEQGLVRWADTSGACCCDCEVIYNSLQRPSARRRGGVECAAAATWREAVHAETARGDRPRCAGVPG